MKAWLGLIWQRLGPYLPILIMAVFALATFWLVRSMPTERGLAPEGPPSHEPDYFLVRFGWRNFGPGGELVREVIGDTLRHYPDTGSVEVDQAQLATWSPEGLRTSARARHVEVNQDRSVIRMEGAVHVTRDSAPATGPLAQREREPAAPWEYFSEALVMESQPERWSSPVAVLIRRGPQQFRADAMVYERPSGTLTLSGRVRGELWPNRSPR
ncbi:lipopolysaccharide export system protein LptC [Tibeticola sediminis]|uniref:Lipopolysaccharide export system protein LptC n=1 Tax=Tibeticola sediminis TaxID=1917811 RepID=A0A3N4V1W6_9BURK|nr:LPS export ABC transporter periplasmic protein LptC [Tibeticola sediminis]RPE66914.1 lipopolysaccharide export system protein LptC [Tibeticola sediminis]